MAFLFLTLIVFVLIFLAFYLYVYFFVDAVFKLYLLGTIVLVLVIAAVIIKITGDFKISLKIGS